MVNNACGFAHVAPGGAHNRTRERLMAKARPDKQSPWFPGWLLKTTLLLAFVILVLGGLVWAGRWGTEQLRGRPRYDVAFAEIECDPPVGMDRHKFLDEVRYYARSLPERLHLLNEDLPQQLREGFAMHPWVEKVDAIEIAPPKRVIVKLTHRTPVLAVPYGAELYAVDRHGVMLPNNAPTRGLPVYDGDAARPAGVGKRWGDANVEAAARELKR
jgi:hypothetical protein